MHTSGGEQSHHFRIVFGSTARIPMTVGLAALRVLLPPLIHMLLGRPATDRPSLFRFSHISQNRKLPPVPILSAAPVCASSAY